MICERRAAPPRSPVETLALVRRPTPLHRVPRLEREVGGPPLYIKRDDLTGFGLGGNKVRKLELLVADAVDRGCDVLVTGGGPGSNHCMTAAAAARAAGLGCVLVLYGDPPAREPITLALARSVGAEVRFTRDDRRTSVDEWLPAAVDELSSAGRRPYLVPRGGATPLGAIAYAQAIEEVAEQLAALDVSPEVLLVATGSCGTQAGLLTGSVAASAPWRIVGASVSRPVAECVDRVTGLAGVCAERLGARRPRADEVIVLDARGPGYGVPSAEGRRWARVALESEGILLDPVYTAKAFSELARMTGVTGPVVFWHTGGTAAAIDDAAAAGDRGWS